ncbi:hypothetical protein EMCRGX_G014468 [Ephydatia muelleri]
MFRNVRQTSSDALVVQDHQNIAYLGTDSGTSSDALVVQDHQNIAYLGQTVGNVRQTSSDALVVQDHQNIAYLGQTVGNVRQTSSDALVVQDHQNIAYLGQTVGNVRQTSSDALVVQDHQNIAYLGQTVGQTSSDALVVQDHQNIAYLGQTVGNVRQTSSDALVVQDHQNIAYLGQTVGNVRQTSSDALVVQDHQNIAYLGQTTSSDALVVQDHQNIAYLGQTVGNVRQTSSDALVVQDHQNIAYLGQTRTENRTSCHGVVRHSLFNQVSLHFNLPFRGNVLNYFWANLDTERCCRGQQTPCAPVSPLEAVFVASIRSGASIVNGLVGGMTVEIMLDSGSSVSLIRQDIAKCLNGTTSAGDTPKLRLVSAGGEELPIVNSVKAAVKLRGIVEVPEHSFIVVEQLISQVILGVDFLQQQGLVLDFTTSPVSVTVTRQRKQTPDPVADEADECAIPIFNELAEAEFPGYIKSCFEETVQQARDQFVKTPGQTTLACHQINTVGPPARVPPRRIPAHFQQEVQEQMNDMLRKGIIVESSSAWLAPAVYTRKKTGEIRLCVDYREVNKRTSKDAYPLPLIDEVQDRLSGATIFSKLDLQCGYWQVPVDPKDQEKTAFSPGPGMGLFQFTRMPFGLCGAPSTFQRLMDVVMRGLPFITTYIDDVLIHSASEEMHKSHLEQAGGADPERKQVEGMSPDRSKVEAVVNWPQPKDEAEVRQFLGLASYYRKYIDRFADIAAPLHQLTQKDTPFQWTQACEESFQRLKASLTEAPVLAYPRFDKLASTMVLQTDASNVGLGAVLEQDHVIQRECLAIVWAMKQFRHYLLGRTFQLMTDHAPLQWLGEQKMEGLLCRWALAIQEFSFEIVYRKGSTNGNADALSRRRGPDMETKYTALTTVHASFTAEEIRQAQQQDETIQQLYKALQSEQRHPHRHWKQPPLRRYAQLWPQLVTVDGIVCRKYQPGPTSETIVVPVLPETLHQQALSMGHDSPAAGHQGTLKTLERIRREAYWVNMAQDVDRHCRECATCQKSKLPMPDYFTKWADARPLPDQTAIQITAELVKLFCTYGVPEIVHSDQGRNFESSIVQSTLDAFGAPSVKHVNPPRGYEATSYQAVLQAKMAELQDLVEAHIAESASRQKVDYDRHSAERQFKSGDLVWLSVPTAGKLDPRWEGNWTVRSTKSSVTVEITDGERTKVVHTNRLHRRTLPAVKSQLAPHSATPADSSTQPWEPPGVDHFEQPTSQAERRYPPRERHAPERLGY